MADPVRKEAPKPSQPRFGRLRAKDARDKRYRMLAIAPVTTRTKRNWSSSEPIWDQGSTPQCVAFSGDRVLVTRPIVTALTMSHSELYRACQLVDEWEGEDYDGTSVRACMKVFQSRGIISNYVWADTLEQAFPYLMEVGPIHFGCDWTENMMETDRAGFIQPDGEIVGGHAVMIKGYNGAKRCPDSSLGAYRIENSWGADWGQNGRCWISVPDMRKLVTGLEGWPADMASPTEIKVKPA